MDPLTVINATTRQAELAAQAERDRRDVRLDMLLLGAGLGFAAGVLFCVFAPRVLP